MRSNLHIIIKKREPTVLIIAIICFSLVVTVLTGFVIRKFVVQAYKIPSASMMPTLLVGDHILVDKTVSGEDVKRGDIIVFKWPKDTRKSFVKRVVGVSGDKIEIRDKQLYINGNLLKEDYVIHTYDSIRKERDNFGPVTVPNDSLFMLGDNRDNSYDSRMVGFVNYHMVEGKVIKIYWSWDRVNSTMRWERIGMKVQ